MAYELRKHTATLRRGDALNIDIFFRHTEAGAIWYVWLHSSAYAYLFPSMEHARSFACALSCPGNRAICISAQRSLEQAATLI